MRGRSAADHDEPGLRTLRGDQRRRGEEVLDALHRVEARDSPHHW